MTQVTAFREETAEFWGQVFGQADEQYYTLVCEKAELSPFPPALSPNHPCTMGLGGNLFTIDNKQSNIL